MTSAFQSINNSLGAIGSAAGAVAAAAGAQAAGGGKFSFSPEEIEGIAKDWTDLASQYFASYNDTERVVIVGPGNEDASDGQAQAAMQSWQLYRESLLQKYEYSAGQAQKFHDSLAAYRGTDSVNVRDLINSGNGGSTGGRRVPGGI
ncbi:hypothetical protein [Actinokineospora bangkokensis]|uniref:PE domain-containing protein n=1 Tax=Actinokineospora bangkokensis TaxID=1193682 RepID=A0A1Q9LG92_9PSEU|nr:hypothetical protein [Actinokineospora bangkokensis]OLR90969.1 hypothetical protein BJP25_30945 [Actinokineospora bangkokensis]